MALSRAGFFITQILLLGFDHTASNECDAFTMLRLNTQSSFPMCRVLAASSAVSCSRRRVWFPCVDEDRTRPVCCAQHWSKFEQGRKQAFLLERCALRRFEGTVPNVVMVVLVGLLCCQVTGPFSSSMCASVAPIFTPCTIHRTGVLSAGMHWLSCTCFALRQAGGYVLHCFAW